MPEQLLIPPSTFGYLAYLKQIVRIDLYPKYEWVLDALFTLPYYWSIELDDIWATYGLEIRTCYAESTGDFPCIPYMDGMTSVLEMLIAIAVKGETDVMCDPALGDRTYIWFWMMINKLRLDDCSNPAEIEAIVSRLLTRAFEPNGEGSICGPFINHPQDMRGITFWYQFRFWAQENYTFDS